MWIPAMIPNPLKPLLGPWRCAPALLAALLPTWAVAGPCDPTLLQQAKGIAAQARYGPRRNDPRCEGFYSSRVSGTGGLEVVGLLQRPLRFARNEPALTIAAAVPDRAVRVRGRLLPPDRYYRLDAALTPNGTLRWPLRLLTERGYRPSQVALYGFLADDPDWLVPLDVQGAAAPAAAPRLILRAAVDLADVRWRWAPAQGRSCPVLGDDWTSLGASRAYKPIVIALGGLGVVHRVCVDVQADAVDGNLLDAGGPLRIMLP
jgi:hypothetical protein